MNEWMNKWINEPTNKQTIEHRWNEYNVVMDPKY